MGLGESDSRGAGSTRPLLREPWLRALVQHSADLITLHDRHGTILYAAPSLGHILGYDVEDLIGSELGTLMHAEDRPALAQQFQFLLAHPGVPRSARFRVRHSTGAWRWMEATGTNLLAEPAVAAIVLNQHDVTEQRQAEEALFQSERRFRALVENSEDGIELATSRGTILYVSPSMERILGRPAAEIVGRTVFEMIHADERERMTALWQRTLENPRVPVRAEFRHPHPDGRDRHIEIVRVNHLHDPGLKAVVTIYREVTERRHLEEQVRQAQKMEAVGRLAGGIAHDFNNILSVIHGFASMVTLELPDGDPLRADMQEILQAVDRASALTRQLLAFGRRQVMQPRALSLAHTLRGMEGMLRRVIGEDVTLAIRANEDARHAKADPGQIEQVILNLVVNARDAMPEGGLLTIENGDAELDARYIEKHPDVAPGSYAWVRVSDTGTGMEPPVRERIFEPFFTTKKMGEGTGLGLAMVFGIIKQSGGHITVDSEPGKGSRFCVYLPSTLELARERTPPLAVPELHGSETILLVEDESAVRGFLTRCLRRAGYNVIDTANGGEALLVAEQYPEPIHLLLTDVVMPRLSGPQLAARLAPLRPGLRVLYMSGFAGHGTQGPQGGPGELPEGAPLIEKPLTAEGLGRKVREVLDRPSPPEAGRGDGDDNPQT